MNSKKKGNIWENKLANWLRDNGVKAWKDGASGGGSREKGDIGNNIDFTIESKAAKNIELMKWWSQVNKSASVHHNRPALFVHQDGMPDKQWIVCIHSEDWLDLVKSTLPEAQNAPRFNETGLNLSQLKYRRDAAILALKQLLKELDK